VEAAGVEVVVESITQSAATLVDHLERGAVAEALEEASWDWVVCQEQSTLGTNRFHEGRTVMSDLDAFEGAAASLLELIHANGARPALLLTWARRAAKADQAVLNDGIVRAAARGNAVVIPAGPAWLEALETSGELPLYLRDGAHPAPAGTYLVAYSVLREIFGPASSQPRTDFTGFDHVPDRVALGADAAATIRAAVDRTVRRTGSTGRGLPQRAALPIELESPASSEAGPESYEGRWTGSVQFLDDQTPSILELQLTAAEPGSEMSMVLLFDHNRLRAPADQLPGFFPNQSASIAARIGGGLLVFEHAAQGFGSTYHYEFALHDAQLKGWVGLNGSGRPIFTATVSLERME
jgi:hypothetical protein